MCLHMLCVYYKLVCAREVEYQFCSLGKETIDTHSLSVL